ncbi:MAG: tetratricopeptide repeat protein [Terracidiphilus sp.]
MALLYGWRRILREDNGQKVESLLQIVLKKANTLPPEEARAMIPLTLCNLSLLYRKLGREEDSRQKHDEASKLLDQEPASSANWLYHSMMSDALMALGEHRRAIPFCGKQIELAGEEVTPTDMAEMLHQLGMCYCRIGLKELGTVPLRAALKVFRPFPEDPRLASVLLTLGNSLRKSSPSEAEACYRESAELESAKLQYQSATAPWGNLAIMYSEQGRYDESLELYDKVLRVREQMPGSGQTAIARTHNNIANCYRRMGRFEEALASVDRSIELYPPGKAGLASSYGTRALIFQDWGRDDEAVEWFRKSYAERRKEPSPNFESTVDDLESEIAALERLGREEEVAVAREILSSVRAEMAAVPQIVHELSAMKEPPGGAVTVELSFGSRPGIPDGKSKTRALTEKLSEVLDDKCLGYSSGWVMIPENTTMLFYGEDSETLFKALDPILRDDPICAGATIVVRQGEQHRVLVIPGEASRPN